MHRDGYPGCNNSWMVPRSPVHMTHVYTVSADVFLDHTPCVVYTSCTPTTLRSTSSSIYASSEHTSHPNINASTPTRQQRHPACAVHRYAHGSSFINCTSMVSSSEQRKKLFRVFFVLTAIKGDIPQKRLFRILASSAGQGSVKYYHTAVPFPLGLKGVS